MIRKVAISQAFRAAFPNEYEGLYTIDEMEASGAIPGQYKVVESTGEIIDIEETDPKISQEQRQVMFRTVQQAFGRDEGNRILKELISEEGFDSTNDMPSSVYGRVMEKIMRIADERSREGGAPAPEE